MTRALIGQAKAQSILHSQNAKATHALKGQSLVVPAAGDDFKINLKKNFIAPFYGWGSTASRLQRLRGGSLVKKGKIADTSFTNTYFDEYLPMSACE